MQRASITIVILCGLWLVLIVAAPFLAALGHPAGNVSSRLYAFFSQICHQEESRSLHLFGRKLAVCARCTAIYSCFFIGILIHPLVRSLRRLRPPVQWAVALVPILVDVCCDVTGIHASTMVTRIVTGSHFGIVAGVMLMPAAIEGLSDLFHHFGWDEGLRHELKT